MAEALFNPRTIFWPYYLATALVITLAWLLASGRSARNAISEIFSKEVWLTRSTLIDLSCSVFYLLLLREFVSTVERATFTTARQTAEVFFTTSITSPWMFALTPLAEGLGATLVTMLSIDFASYATHRALHAWPLLWKVHRFHHSAEKLTPLTTYRQHPLEPLLLYGARGLGSGVGLTIFYQFFPQQTPVITVFGLGAGFFIYMFTVNLHHWPVPVRYPRVLRAVLISPHIHHLHHSVEPRHHGRNFGVVFSVWDRMFGTYLDESVEPGGLRFGYQPPPLPLEAPLS